MQIFMLIFGSFLLLSASANAESLPAFQDLQLTDTDHIAMVDFQPLQDNPIAYDSDAFQETGFQPNTQEWEVYVTNKNGHERFKSDMTSKLLFVGFEYKFDQ